MQKLISNETEASLVKLGLYQIVGGIMGVLLLVWGIFKSLPLSAVTVTIYLFIFLFFAYSIFCGTLCLKANTNCLNHSLANQMLQAIGFAIAGFAFKYIAGIYLTIELDFTDSMDIKFGAGISTVDFNFNNERERTEIDFNLIAFALIYWIDKLMKKAKEEGSIREASLFEPEN